MLGDAGAGDEPLAAVDDPLVALLSARVRIMLGIGAAAGRGLGHGEGGAHLAVDDRLQPPVLLRRRADLREHIHVAVVGRRAVERDRPEDRAVQLPRTAPPGRRSAAPCRRAPSASAAPTGPRPWPSPARRAARRGGCSRARRNSPGRLRAAARAPRRSARVRRRMSSISGESVKSMDGLSVLRHLALRHIVTAPGERGGSTR